MFAYLDLLLPILEYFCIMSQDASTCTYTGTCTLEYKIRCNLYTNPFLLGIFCCKISAAHFVLNILCSKCFAAKVLLHISNTTVVLQPVHTLYSWPSPYLVDLVVKWTPLRLCIRCDFLFGK